MSQENVEIVRRVWEPWERGDLTAWLSLMSDDLVSRRHAGMDSTTYHGREGFLEQAAEWIEGFAEWAVAVEEFVDAGDRVVVRNRHRKFVRVDMFVDEREALEAAGLSE